jgi:hypothetical protein
MRRASFFLVLGLAAGSALAQSKEPILLREMGSFHIGGRVIEITGQPIKEVVFTPGGVPAKMDPNGKYQVEQMYVQYFLPQNRKGKLPLLFWHGGGLTGVTYETKPDGGDGWLTYFIRRGIAAATDTRLRALLLTAVLTGLRASELRGLRWADVDLKKAELHVRQRADRFNRIGAPKSVSSRRTVLLDPDTLIPALKEWKLACPKAEGDLVVPTASGQIQDLRNLSRNLEVIYIAAGVTDKSGAPKYALHALRHFFASWCINPKDRGGRELPAKVVQHLLGHTSITLTFDRYGHLFPRGDDHAELASATRALLG